MMRVAKVEGIGHGDAFVPVKDDPDDGPLTAVDEYIEDRMADPVFAAEYRAESQSIKASNPKDAIGSRKVPFHLVPQQVVGEVALGMLEGACKYGAYNYRAIGVRSSVYRAAADRHLGAWWEGQDIDPKSGLHHIAKAIASLVVLRDAMIQGKCEDDRPPPSADPDWIEKLNAEAARILDEHPNPKQPYTIGRPK